MTDSVENRVLEHVRPIHDRDDQLADDVAQLKHRMTSLEGAMTLVKREIAYGDEPDARQ